MLNLTEGCQQPQTHLQEGCPSYIHRGNLCAISLRKVKIKAKNQESTHSFKTVRGPYANNVLFIHNTNSPYQSRETVLLNISLRVTISRQIGLVPVPYLPFRLQSLRREMSIKRIYTHSLTAVRHETVFGNKRWKSLMLPVMSLTKQAEKRLQPKKHIAPQTSRRQTYQADPGLADNSHDTFLSFSWVRKVRVMWVWCRYLILFITYIQYVCFF